MPSILLGNQLLGEVFTNLAIVTEEGVKVADVAWGSDAYFEQHRHDFAATAAPEICVEIVSRSNTKCEMKTKVNLFLKAGAV